MVAQMESLPSLSALYVELMREVQSETSSMAKISGIISRDIGMTAKVLQLVNSAFFGHIRHVSSPAQAAYAPGETRISKKFQFPGSKFQVRERFQNQSFKFT